MPHKMFLFWIFMIKPDHSAENIEFTYIDTVQINV